MKNTQPPLPFGSDPVVRIFVGPDPADDRNLLLGYQRASGDVQMSPISRPLLEALRGSWQALEVLPALDGQHECRHVDLQRPVTYALLG